MPSQIEQIISQLGNKSTEIMALGGLQKIIIENFPSVEPYVSKIFPKLLEIAEKREHTKAAQETGSSLLSAMDPSAIAAMVPAVLPALMSCLEERAQPTQQETALGFITQMVQKDPQSIAAMAGSLAGPISQLLQQNKQNPQVAAAATETMGSFQAAGAPQGGSGDLSQYMPLVMGAAQMFFAQNGENK